MKTLLMTTVALGAVLTLGAPTPTKAEATQAVASTHDKATIQDVEHRRHDRHNRHYWGNPGYSDYDYNYQRRDTICIGPVCIYD